MMHKDYLWNIICPRVNVGSPIDHDRTNMPYTRHEEEMLCRIVCDEVSAELTNEYVGNDN